MSNRRKRRSIFDVINEYMEEIESTPAERPSWDITTHTIEPLCNVSVTPTEVVVTADLPFSDPQSIRAEPLDEKTLEISARIGRRICCEDLGIVHQTGEFSTFNCQIRIPVAVDVKKRKVKLRKGVLEVRLERKKRHEIEVE